MIIDHRTYTVPHGKMEEYLTRYETLGLPVQQRYLGNVLGCYVSEIGALNQVVFLWGYESLADRETRRLLMEKDPEWAVFREKNAGAFVSQETKIMRPTAFSPKFLKD